MKSYHKLLREVRDSLTAENWDKDCYYFSNKNNKLYMSVHGAAQRLVNLQVGKVLENNNISDRRSLFKVEAPRAGTSFNLEKSSKLG